MADISVNPPSLKLRRDEKAKIGEESEEIGIRLSVSEAAKFFGVSPRTIRRAITDGAGEDIVVQARYKIDLASLLDWADKTTTVRNKLAKQGVGQFVDRWRMKV